MTGEGKSVFSTRPIRIKLVDQDGEHIGVLEVDPNGGDHIAVIAQRRPIRWIRSYEPDEPSDGESG